MRVKTCYTLLLNIFLASILIAEAPNKWKGYWEKPINMPEQTIIANMPSFFNASALVWIRIYQKGISSQDLPSCVFHPSCSRFAFGAIERYGAVKGILLAGDRLMRCNPFAFRHYEFDGEKFVDPVERYNLR